MLRQLNKRLALQCLRRFSTTNQSKFKVACLGAAGGIGQPLSILLKMNCLITELAVYDIVEHTPGICMDISHIDTNCAVKGYTGDEELPRALEYADIVIISAGKTRTACQSREELFKDNAEIVMNLTCEIAKCCPKALIVIATSPINSILPFAAEILKIEKTYDPKRMFGVSLLDVMRTKTFAAEIMGCDPKMVKIPVIGAHAGKTIIPLFSQCHPEFNGNAELIEKLIKRIRLSGTELVKIKNSSATLSIAYAISKFVNSLLLGLKGKDKIIECCYAPSTATEAEFFAAPFEVGVKGIYEHKGLPPMNKFEESLLDIAMPEIVASIDWGIAYARKKMKRRKK